MSSLYNWNILFSSFGEEWPSNFLTASCPCFDQGLPLRLLYFWPRFMYFSRFGDLSTAVFNSWVISSKFIFRVGSTKVCFSALIMFWTASGCCGSDLRFWSSWSSPVFPRGWSAVRYSYWFMLLTVLFIWNVFLITGSSPLSICFCLWAYLFRESYTACIYLTFLFVHLKSLMIISKNFDDCRPTSSRLSTTLSVSCSSYEWKSISLYSSGSITRCITSLKLCIFIVARS